MISIEQSRKYCYEVELIENYDMAVADKEHMWHCHHRVETIMNCGKKELKAQGCYYNRPAHELIFLTGKEHRRLHSKGNKNFLGRKHSEETRMKMSEAKNGEKHPNFGKKGEKSPRFGKKHSEEAKRKMSEARKRYWEKRREGTCYT